MIVANSNQSRPSAARTRFAFSFAVSQSDFPECRGRRKKRGQSFIALARSLTKPKRGERHPQVKIEIPIMEFVWRGSLDVLPKGMVRVRHYGPR